LSKLNILLYAIPDVNGVKVVCVLCQTVFVYKPTGSATASTTATTATTSALTTSILKPQVQLQEETSQNKKEKRREDRERASQVCLEFYL
jgi:hypothetical protein